MGKLANWLQLPLLVLGLSVSAAELEPKTIRDFSPGLFTDADSTIIPDGASQDLQNVDVEDGSIRKRKGSVKVNSSAIGAGLSVRYVTQYVDPSSTFWLLSVSSNTIYKSNDGGATNSVGTSGLGITATTRFQTANAFGKVYFVSPSTNVITFNGTAFAQNTDAPLGDAVGFFADRIWIGQNSTLYGSRVADDTDWTDNGVDDADAISFTIRNNDGYQIRAVVPFGPDLLVFKDYSIDRLVLNSDGLTFSLLPVTSSLGTTYPETVKVTDNRVVWLAHDGVYAYNGSTIKRISENIQPTFEGLAQLSAAGRSYTESTQAQFAAGTSSGVATGVVTDSVVLSTWTDTDTTAADFAAGSLTNVTTSTVAGVLTLSTNNTDVLNNSFESCSGGVAANWTATGSGQCTLGVTPQDGSYSEFIGTTLRASGVLTVTVLDPSDSLLATVGSYTMPSLSSSWTQKTVDTAQFVGRNIKIRFEVDSSAGSPGTVTSDLFFASASSTTFYVYKLLSGTIAAVFVDLSAGGRSTIYSGSFTSQTFDTALDNSRLWLASDVTYTANSHTAAFYTQASSDGLSWDSRVSWTSGSAPTSASKRYIRYQVEFATATAGTGLPFVSDVTLSARGSYGRYKSAHATLTGITSWGTFGANQTLNDGSITYEIYTDTDTTMPLVNGVPTQYVSSQTISIGGTPTIATAAYAVIGATFSITSATQAPQMDDFTLRWNEGNSTLYPAAMFWNQRYYLALAVNSSTENDEIFLYDRNGAWTRHTGIPVGSMGIYRTRPFVGTTDGFFARIEEPNTYQDYDGGAIDAYWISKDFDLGYPITSKTLVRYYLTGNYAADAAVTFSYGVERGTLTSASYNQTTSGFWRQTVKPSSLTYSEGIQHRFKVANSTVDSSMSILSITGRWNLNTNP